MSEHHSAPRRHLVTRGARLAAGLAVAALVLVGCGGGDEDAKVVETTSTTATSSTTATASTSDGGTGTGTDVWGEDAQPHRGENGKTFTIDCSPGGKAQTVWGAGTYTDDSSICTAAVQSGLITFADGGEVTYEIAAGLDEYEGGIANGVTSERYGSWDGSFTFPDAPPGSVDMAVTAASWSRTAAEYGAETGKQVTVACSAGGRAGSVWGSDPYTSDSSICTAAVHAGLITLADGGTVLIEVTAGADSYDGSTAHGVTTSEYGSYGSSFTFPKDQPGT